MIQEQLDAVGWQAGLELSNQHGLLIFMVSLPGEQMKAQARRNMIALLITPTIATTER